MEATESHPDWSREAAALRRLARGLLDPQASEDAVQEAWLRAHTRAGGPAAEPAAFWRRIVANFSHDVRRRAARRAQREALSAHPEALPSTDEVAARLELIQLVAASVAELAEPYRSTIHLRFFEDLSVQEVAARSGVPLETTRTRLRRGLDLLRQRLDQSVRGGRRDWCLLLAPLATRTAAPLPNTTVLVWPALAKGVFLMKPLVLTVAALITAGLIWLSWRPDDASNSARFVADAARLSVGVEEPATQAPGEAIDRAPLLVAPAGSAVANAMPAEATHMVHGTLLLRDPERGDRSAADGWLLFERSAAAGQQETEVAVVEAGRWSIEGLAGERLEFVSAFLAGIPADLEALPVEVPHGSPVALEAQAFPVTTLQVVDAATGQDLDGIELRWGTQNFIAEALRHPGDVGPLEFAQTGLSSPFQLEIPVIEEIPLRLWVQATGYAWNHVDVQLRTGGTRTVRLFPGGDLEVLVLGARPEVDWRVALFEAGDDPLKPGDPVAWQVPAEGQVTGFAGLAPGRYQVGAWLLGEDLIAESLSAVVELTAGQTASVSIALGEQPAPAQRTHLTGTLRWDGMPTPQRLELYPSDLSAFRQPVILPASGMTPDPGQPGLLRWDAGEIAVGEYVAVETDLGLYQPFEAGPGPATEVFLEAPKRAALVVRARSAGDGRAIPEVSGSYRVLHRGRLPFFVEHPLARDEERGLVRADVPALALEVKVSAPGWSAKGQTVELVSGETRELDLELERLTGLVVRLFEGKARLRSTYPRPLLHDSAGQKVRLPLWDWEDSDCQLLVPPGEYRLSLEGLAEEGWQTPDWLTVSVVQDALTPVDIQLKRAE
jgi:RNA polymerase sigma-70 factor (ECF subfamily)